VASYAAISCLQFEYIYSSCFYSWPIEYYFRVLKKTISWLPSGLSPVDNTRVLSESQLNGVRYATFHAARISASFEPDLRVSTLAVSIAILASENDASEFRRGSLNE
jgi:hypothetical protein